MPWIFEITTGKMFDPNGQLAGMGYAGGNLGKNPEGRNNPTDESLQNIGPLPEGLYTFSELFLKHSRLGPYAIRLDPDSEDEMYGRSGFWVHGDTTPPGNASEGCIIQARTVREQMWNSSDHRLRVVADRDSEA